MVLWLCSLICGFGPRTNSSVGRHKAENWCGISLRSRGECRRVVAGLRPAFCHNIGAVSLGKGLRTGRRGV